MALRKWIFPTPREKLVKEWCRIQGDITMRLDYDLSADSVVLDLGGFEGQWASDIFSRYMCRVLVCDPVPEFASRIRARFARNPKISTFVVGLGGRTRIERLFLASDGSSIVAGYGSFRDVQIHDVASWLDAQRVTEIDLVKVNIEGAEYELLDRALETGLVASWRNIQVQFHENIDRAQERRAAIQERLRATHDLKYNFDFVWEGWTKKPS